MERKGERYRERASEVGKDQKIYVYAYIFLYTKSVRESERGIK